MITDGNWVQVMTAKFRKHEVDSVDKQAVFMNADTPELMIEAIQLFTCGYESTDKESAHFINALCSMLRGAVSAFDDEMADRDMEISELRARLCDAEAERDSLRRTVREVNAIVGMSEIAERY